MTNLMVSEVYINQTKGHGFGDSGWYEAYTDDRGELYRAMQKEFGRCVSKMYRDQKNAPPIAVGWVFQSRQQYDDWGRFQGGDRYYIREVWVEVREGTKDEDDE